MSYSLELAFDTNSREFCRGFEAASVYDDARRFSEGEHIEGHADDDSLVETVHATNAEMMLRIAERFELQVQSEELDHGWMHVVFTKGAAP